MYYFSSDWHLFHDNIIRYCHRPFETVVGMNNIIFDNTNEVVDANDTLFFIGDFFMSKSNEAPNSLSKKEGFDYCRNKINCKNMIFIKGNHDGKRNGTDTIILNTTIELGGKKIFMCHDPQYAKEDYYFNFCGHVHEKYKFKKLGDKSTIVNLSVEVWDYKPVDYTRIFQDYSHWIRGGRK
jgi:calcineurin-like phosphoesterase family protein